MAESPYANDELPEDDGVLEPDASLETDDLSQDPLDAGLAVPDGWSPAEQFGAHRPTSAPVSHWTGACRKKNPRPAQAAGRTRTRPGPSAAPPSPGPGAWSPTTRAGGRGPSPTSWPRTSASTLMRPALRRRRYTWSPKRGRTRRGSFRLFSRHAPPPPSWPGRPHACRCIRILACAWSSVAARPAVCQPRER
jgi:hypothetical protein